MDYALRDIRYPPNVFKPQLRYLELDGLYAKETWKIRRCLYISGALVVLVILGGKFIWGTWEIVFGAGSFFVAVPMLILTVLSYSN
jgi:hypothetical protein